MVNDNCEPKYKNLNRIQSFSEQRYVTVQLMEQACMNDEYLKQTCDLFQPFYFYSFTNKCSTALKLFSLLVVLFTCCVQIDSKSSGADCSDINT